MKANSFSDSIHLVSSKHDNNEQSDNENQYAINSLILLNMIIHVSSLYTNI